MAAESKMGNALLVLLSPAVLCWTVYCFWRLATTGTLHVRDHGGIIEASGGFNFWVTIGLYVVLLIGSVVVLITFAGWIVARLRGKK